MDYAKKIARLLTVNKILQKTRLGISINQILEKLKDNDFNVSKRTVYRDIETLCASGYPIGQHGTLFFSMSQKEEAVDTQNEIIKSLEEEITKLKEKLRVEQKRRNYYFLQSRQLGGQLKALGGEITTPIQELVYSQ